LDPRESSRQPAIPAELAREDPEIAAGVAAFDCWIANADRHTGNFAYSRATNATHLFDHDMALLGLLGTRRLGSLASSHLLEKHPVAACIRDVTHLAEWASIIQGINRRSIELPLLELVSEGLLDRANARTIAELLEKRARGIFAMLQQAKADNAFPNAETFLI
jgi:hypothetical protein